MVPVARVEVVDRLPGDQVSMVLERQGEICFLLRRDAPLEHVATSLQGDMQHEINSGLWDQNWPGGGPGKDETETDTR